MLNRPSRPIVAAIMLVLGTLPFREPAVAAGAPVVTTEAGQLRGEEADGVISFKGVPYARPPVNELRWRPPQGVSNWQGTRDATAFGPECMQVDDVQKSEDCLFLNIWRPTEVKEPMPVMAWIYGGSLVHGQTSLYPAENLARQGVVVVSMNYRMGRLGFFAHPSLLEEQTGELHGNYGYMDQIAALKWVRHNIAAFGGDPGQVTIFGESAGAGSVLTHLTSPLSRDLFHRAILQSPGIPTPRAKVVGYSDLDTARHTASAYAQSLGITGDGKTALLALRALSAKTLTEGTSSKDQGVAFSSGKPLLGVAGSMIDGTLVREPVEEAIAAGRWKKIPIIIGANERDLPVGTAASKEELFGLFGEDAKLAQSIYDPKGELPLDELKQQVFADRTMTEPARYLADLVAQGGGIAYLYRFSYVAESLRGSPAWKGTPHGLEIPYTFDLPAAIVKDKVTDGDLNMGALASAYWVAFGKTGDPNGDGRPVWPRHEAGSNTILNFKNEGVKIEEDPLKPRLDLWRRVWIRAP